jgi:hypothetical protein
MRWVEIYKKDGNVEITITKIRWFNSYKIKG